MQQSGRLKEHHAPQSVRQNFFRKQTTKDLNKVEPTYIVNYDDLPSKLDRRLSKEREEKRQKRNKTIKKIVAWSFIALAVLLLLLVLVLMLLYFLTCSLGNCPKGCYDCQFSESNWKKSRGSNSFSASHRYCGKQPLSVKFTDNMFSVDSSISLGSKRGLSTPSPLIHAFSTIEDGVSTSKLKLYWYTDKSVRNNETLKLVFSDNGDQYSGAGNFGEQMIRSKPSTDKSYTWWSSEEDPIYFPYYMTRNKDASICMFLESAGAPVEVTVKSTVTEWLIYRLDKMDFHIYSASTPYEALTKCTAKWQELHASPNTFWSDNFILGSLTTSQVKQAQTTSGILATHYLLSSESLSLTDSGVEVNNETVLSNYDNIFYTWDAKQKILPDSGISTTPENGYYKINGSDYYLDYTTDSVKSVMNNVVAVADTQGFLLKGGYLLNQTVDCHEEYLQCSTMDYAKDSNMCLDTTFSDGRVVETHNNYDRTRTTVLRSADNTVFESVASPGTTHFHRDVALTLEGLRTCFNNIVNLQAVGVRGVTCNMCGGFLPTDTDIDESFACDKLSMLGILMPYIIMTNEKTPQYISATDGAGRYINNNLEIRKEFKFELDAAFRTAIADSKPFVHPVSAQYYDDIYTESDGVIIGERLFFAADLEKPAGNMKIALPPGPWFSNGGPQRGQYYGGGNVINQASRAFIDLIFFRVGNIYVLSDPEIGRDNHVVVRIFKSYETYESILTHDFVYYEPGTTTAFTTTIEFDPIDKEISFTYKNPGLSVDQDLQISTIEIYLWHEAIKNSPSWVTFQQNANKYDVTLDYIKKGSTNSIFETWTQDSSVFGNGV